MHKDDDDDDDDNDHKRSHSVTDDYHIYLPDTTFDQTLAQ